MTPFPLSALDLMMRTFLSRAPCLGSPWYSAWLESQCPVTLLLGQRGNTRRSQTGVVSEETCLQRPPWHPFLCSRGHGIPGGESLEPAALSKISTPPRSLRAHAQSAGSSCLLCLQNTSGIPLKALLPMSTPSFLP